MAGKLSGGNFLPICGMMAAVLLSQMVVTSVMCEKTGKDYQPFEPHRLGKASSTSQVYSNLCQQRPSCPTDPSTPRHGGGGSYGTPTPSHGGGGSYGTPTPSHGGGGYYSPPGGVSPPTPAPSHGGGGYYSPPGGVSTPSPVVDPGTPTPSGGGHYTPPGGVCTPSPVVDPGTPTPSGGGHYTPPGGVSTPSPVVDPGTPTPSGGGYYTPPGGVSTPSPVVDPGTPTPPGGGYYTPPGGVYPPSPVAEPGTPATPTSPLVPSTPDRPGISTPPSPFVPDPNQPPPFFTGTGDYWRTHPQVIWGIFGYWITLGGFLGAAGTPVRNLGVLEALRNTRTDGVGALYREGTAAFLNSVVNPRGFPFSTVQVRDAFAAALASEQAAANQARVFSLANEGLLRH